MLAPFTVAASLFAVPPQLASAIAAANVKAIVRTDLRGVRDI
jgi:hypothetical protein